tara:strand:- start:880 stop:1146 length:267 start_codon:yes stop_codon:yes gene_type:complete
MSDKKQQRVIPNLPSSSNFAERFWIYSALQSLITQEELLTKLQEQHGEDGSSSLEASTLQMMDMLKDEALSSLIDDMNNSQYFTVGES